MKRCPVIPSHRFCSETIKGVMEKSWKKGMKQDILSSIKSLMETMGWMIDQAMTALEVPAKLLASQSVCFR